MDSSTLEFLWYLVVGLSMIFYTILDGFDLGVGMLHKILAKTDEERRIFLNAIGPVWDGNEVWLVIIVGALFAGFPVAYATLLSGFYNLVMILLAVVIFRAVAIEFRSKKESPAWRALWDFLFFFSSFAMTFIFGLGLGNFMMGVPLDSSFVYIGDFSTFFRPYAVLIALFSVSALMMHGSIYLAMKTEKKLQKRIKKFSIWLILSFLVFFIVVTIATFLSMPYMIDPFYRYPLLFLIPIFMILVLLNIFYQMKKGRNGWAFVSSSLGILLLLVLFGIGRYPYLLHSTINPQNNSLTIYNASSSDYTLGVLLIIVCIGLPLVLTYGYWTYYLFRGKVKLDEKSY